MSYDYRQEVKAHLKSAYGKTVQIRFDGNDPTLIFADGASSETKSEAMSFVKRLIEEMGGEVEFYLELETVTK
jgi:hypothetical protein